MLTYIYFVKCPNCEDEHFNFFDDAKAFARGCMSKKPIITQTEVERNDFGECTDYSDLGQIWSWEDEIGEPDAEPETQFSIDDIASDYNPDTDPEFADDDFFAINTEESSPTVSAEATAGNATLDDSCKSGAPIFEDDQVLATNKKGDFLIPASSGYGYTVFNRSNVCIGHIDSETDEDAIRRFNLGDLDEACEKRPLPEGMTIEQLIEEMEENEDTVECVCCNELYPKEECKHDEKHGWICPDCQDEVVECTWCEELYDKSECRYEVDLGWLCSRCEAAIKSRGETLTFREGNYWDFLDEEVKELHDLGNTYDGGYPGTEEDQGLLADDPKEPASNVEKLEEADEYRKRLTTCTECGGQSYDAETRFCLKCGFN
jgi:hypothetical protein